MRPTILLAVILTIGTACLPADAQSRGFRGTIVETQPKLVKISGSGGFAGLEPYQSGFLISPDGFVLTVWSYVLDSEDIAVTLNDGQLHSATLVGYDPRNEIAVLKLDTEGLPHFELAEAADVRPGSRVLAFSNLYGVATGNEPVSVQHGVVAAKTTLSARRGASDSMYQGEVFILDAVTNNPGAAGGAITDRQGRLLGLIGKEVRDKQTNSWLNFALPVHQLEPSVEKILAGEMIVEANPNRRKPSEPMTLDLLGIVLVPNVVDRTPPFIDRVIATSASAMAGLAPDDLIVEFNGRLTPSYQELRDQLLLVDRDSEVQLLVQRHNEFKLFRIRVGQ